MTSEGLFTRQILFIVDRIIDLYQGSCSHHAQAYFRIKKYNEIIASEKTKHFCYLLKNNTSRQKTKHFIVHTIKIAIILNAPSISKLLRKNCAY